MARVSVGTCANLAEAALVRSVFGAHEIHVLINAEQHASMLGGLGGAFLPLHIFVDDKDAEAASALLADVRAKHRGDDAFEESDAEYATGTADHVDVSDEEAAAAIKSRSDRRRKVGTILLIMLAMAFGLPYVSDRPLTAGLLLAAGVSAVFATMWTRRPKGPEIPRARIKR